ncbi:MAG: GNAT family N-acetyltransferase [Candidatus Hydrogenedentes bacterium]|nr:GNAT family N-acetyltransferase [Candidatus Hydrogenedentota bacterium]
MLRLGRLDTLPSNIDAFIDENAAGMAALYGPQAAAAYRLTARKAIHRAIAHPAVDAVAVADGPDTAGLALAMVRGDVGRLSFVHVLARYADRGVEQRLVEEVVRTLRAGGVAGIVSEYVPFCRLNLEDTYAELGFVPVKRRLMGAELNAPPLGASARSESRACNEAGARELGAVIADAYVDHPGRLLHAEVRDIDSATEFVQSVFEGAFGRVRPGYIRAIERDGAAAAMIAGCEVAPEVGFVLQVAVKQDWQGQGLGSALVRELGGRFREAGLARMALGVTASSPAVSLYARLGFETIRPVTAYAWWRDA